jgi:hypothetical protein
VVDEGTVLAPKLVEGGGFGLVVLCAALYVMRVTSAGVRRSSNKPEKGEGRWWLRCWREGSPARCR